MSVTLPDFMVPSTVTFALVDTGTWSRSPLTGAASRTDRPGERFSVTLVYPPIKSDYEGHRALSALIRGKTDGIITRWEQGALRRVPMGAPVLDGADQQGTSLAVRDAEPNTVFRDGQMFSLEHDGGHYLHMVVAEVLADASGAATLTIEPPLRVIADDGDPLEFAEPVIEGVIEGERWEWELSLNQDYGFTITLEERR